MQTIPLLFRRIIVVVVSAALFLIFSLALTQYQKDILLLASVASIVSGIYFFWVPRENQLHLLFLPACIVLAFAGMIFCAHETVMIRRMLHDYVNFVFVIHLTILAFQYLFFGSKN